MAPSGSAACSQAGAGPAGAAVVVGSAVSVGAALHSVGVIRVALPLSARAAGIEPATASRRSE